MFLSLLLIVASTTQSLLAQMTTFTLQSPATGQVAERNIPVLAGEIFELLTWAPSVLSQGNYLKVDGVEVSTFWQNVGSQGIVLFQPPSLFVAGPKTISVSTAYNLVCTYKMTTVSTVATANVASQAVVIPENSNANADIILESSTDLTNWTAAVAGSYAPSTSKRFFRVRLVTH